MFAIALATGLPTARHTQIKEVAHELLTERYGALAIMDGVSNPPGPPVGNGDGWWLYQDEPIAPGEPRSEAQLGALVAELKKTLEAS